MLYVVLIMSTMISTRFEIWRYRQKRTDESALSRGFSDLLRKVATKTRVLCFTDLTGLERPVNSLHEILGEASSPSIRYQVNLSLIFILF